MQNERALSAARPSAPPAATAPVDRSARFRPDIQGLRALAVAAVVLYHGGIRPLTGGYVGVDMFFVISGFLITSHLLREVVRTGRLDFAGFYARRVRRILPASFVVIALTLGAAFLLQPLAQLKQTAADAIWTAFYVPNIAFARQGTDYLAQTDAPSAFQHFWSLGAEEQFYLLWPLLLVLAFLIGRRSRIAVGAIVVAVGAASLWTCIRLTGTDASWAYFSLPSRAWEFMAGGLVALLLSGRLVLPKAVGALLGWAGVVGIVWAVLRYDDATPFPGTAAIVPVAATALVVLGGARPVAYGPFGLLGLAPLAWVGEISYSLYLVHWPVLTLAQSAVGAQHPLTLGWRIVLMAACVPLAWLLYRFVENPMRRSKGLARAGAAPALMGALIASFLIVLAATGVSSYAERAPQSAGKAVTASVSGVTQNPRGTDFVPSNLTPSLADAADDNPTVYSDGCHLEYDDVVPKSCVFGANPAAPRVVLFGDSHAAQWFPAFDALADQGVISLQVETKSGCPAATLDVLFQEADRITTYPQCNTWRQNVLRELAAKPPAAVVVAQLTRVTLRDGSDANAAEWRAGLQKTLAALPAQSRALVIGDTPFPGSSPTTCLSGALTDASRCALSRADALQPKLDAALRQASGAAHAVYLSPTAYLCNQKDCPAIIGNRLVYRDGSHLTATFAKSLAPLLRQQLAPLL